MSKEVKEFHAKEARKIIAMLAEGLKKLPEIKHNDELFKKILDFYEDNLQRLRVLIDLIMEE